MDRKELSRERRGRRTIRGGQASSKTRKNGHGRCGICSLSPSNKSSGKVKGRRKFGLMDVEIAEEILDRHCPMDMMLDMGMPGQDLSDVEVWEADEADEGTLSTPATPVPFDDNEAVTVPCAQAADTDLSSVSSADSSWSIIGEVDSEEQWDLCDLPI